MAEVTPNKAGQAEEIQKQINQALEELDQIRNQRQAITTPQELQAAEQAIIKATDKLAALLTGLKIQQAVDSDELKEKADLLVHSFTGKLKNQGKRLVSILTSRGKPVKVAATYFSRKKKKKKKNKLPPEQSLSLSIVAGGV
jgi:ATP-dependent 26S proteasome regulatory subunit